MTATKLPAGLIDSDYEVFVEGNDEYALNNGSTIHYKDFPDALKLMIDRIILMRPKAFKALNELKLVDPDSRRKKFIRCNLANFDFTADISACLTKITTEFVSCPIRGKCKHEGNLCSGIAAPNGVVSIREIKIMALIRAGFRDSEICEALFIAPDTLKTTKRNIQNKFGIQRKAMIANEAAIRQIN